MTQRTKEQWHQLFQQQQDSQLSVADFCQQLNIDKYYFSLRKKQLTSSSAEFIPVVKQKKVKMPSLSDNNKRYIQCRFERCVLQFDSLPDVTWLSQLIRALS